MNHFSSSPRRHRPKHCIRFHSLILRLATPHHTTTNRRPAPQLKPPSFFSSPPPHFPLASPTRQNRLHSKQNKAIHHYAPSTSPPSFSHLRFHTFVLALPAYSTLVRYQCLILNMRTNSHELRTGHYGN